MKTLTIAALTLAMITAASAQTNHVPQFHWPDHWYGHH